MGGRGASSSLSSMKEKAGRDPNSYKTVAKVNKEVLANYSKKIYSNEYVLTNNRAVHIHDEHPEDFDKIMRGLKPTLDRPTEVIEDKTQTGTLYFVRKLRQDNQRIVVKMNISNDKEHPHNSIITSHIMNEKSLGRLRRRGVVIYKHDD